MANKIKRAANPLTGTVHAVKHLGDGSYQFPSGEVFPGGVLQFVEAGEAVSKETGFLSLSRKDGEEVYVDGPCRIKVRLPSGGRAQMLFKAPKETRIHRAEVRHGA